MAVLIVERFGRKILLFISDFIMCISIVALGIFFFLDDNKDIICDETTTNLTITTEASLTTVMTEDCEPYSGKFDADVTDSLGWLPLTSLIIYIFAFSIGFGPLPWMMNGEFFSLESKDFASSLATAFNWFCSFMVTTFQQDVEDGLGRGGAYFLYGAVCALGCFFIIFLVPETRGKTPDDMKEYFRKKK